MHSGIYIITNSATGVVYIGSAVDIRRRFGEHKKTLRGNRHKNAFLQNAWNKHGEDVFVFDVLKLCDVELLIKEEQMEIDSRTASCGWNGLYNINPIAGSRLGIKHSESTRAKISESLRGKPGRNTGNKHSEETKLRISQMVYTAETRKKMSAAKLGVKRAPFTQETLMRMSAAQKGRTVSEELRLKWSKERKGLPWGEARRKAQEQRNTQRSNSHGK